jgi:hypothetical protein
MLQAISELVKAYGGPSLLAVIATALGWLARSVLPLWWDRQNKMQDRGWVLVEQRDREIILLRQALMRSSRREGRACRGPRRDVDGYGSPLGAPRGFYPGGAARAGAILAPRRTWWERMMELLRAVAERLRRDAQTQGIENALKDIFEVDAAGDARLEALIDKLKAVEETHPPKAPAHG